MVCHYVAISVVANSGRQIRPEFAPWCIHCFAENSAQRSASVVCGAADCDAEDKAAHFLDVLCTATGWTMPGHAGQDSGTHSVVLKDATMCIFSQALGRERVPDLFCGIS